MCLLFFCNNEPKTCHQCVTKWSEICWKRLFSVTSLTGCARNTDKKSEVEASRLCCQCFWRTDLCSDKCATFSCSFSVHVSVLKFKIWVNFSQYFPGKGWKFGSKPVCFKMNGPEIELNLLIRHFITSVNLQVGYQLKTINIRAFHPKSQKLNTVFADVFSLISCTSFYSSLTIVHSFIHSFMITVGGSTVDCSRML